MADDPLTTFLVELCVEGKTLENYGKNKRKTLEGFGVEEDTIRAIEKPDKDTLKERVGNQQGGRGDREKEANQLAKQAAAFAKSSVDLATSAAAHASAYSGSRKVSSKNGGKKGGKKR